MDRPRRAVDIRRAEAVFQRRRDGTTLVTCPTPLPSYPLRLSDWLEHWAAVVPERVFLAQRDRSGAWRTLSYGAARVRVRAIAQALLSRDLSADRPIVILSGNDIEHQLLGLAAMQIGIPYAPVSTGYSLAATDFAKLRHVLSLITPGLVFAADGQRFEDAIRAAVGEEIEIVITDRPPAGRRATDFGALLSATPGAAVDAAAARVGPETVAKFLFTSGSTGLPKAVICPQRMLTSNQAMIQETFRFLRTTPPVMLDWLPWSHTAGGNHNVGIVLANGGTLYIDEGRPTPDGIAATVRNLREIAPTFYVNMPKGFEELVPYFRRDADLRRTFFSRLQLIYYAGAGLPPHVWDEIDRLALETNGECIEFLTGLGATETGPFTLATNPDYSASGAVGLPAPGVALKLVPREGKYEARVNSPSVTPGYWRQPELTEAAFDEEGFYKLGDALRIVDEAAPLKGFSFAGRFAEDFKLTTGTWVHVGTLRARAIAALAPYVRDVVITGENRDYIGILAIPADKPAAALHASITERLRVLAAENTGSSIRIERCLVLQEPPVIDTGELTDKGTINQRAVLARRAALVDQLYSDPPPPDVIAIGPCRPASSEVT